MDLRDARRLAATALLLAGAAVLWLVFLALDDADLFNWSWPTSALGALTLATWQWLGVGTLAILLAGIVGVVYGLGFGSKAPTRQVQCGECRAVFFIGDNGRRPLTHTCPNCKAFGVYDSKQPAATAKPSVALPEAQAAPRTLAFTCPSCSNPFSVADTGQRPLAIQCPKCGKAGRLN